MNGTTPKRDRASRSFTSTFAIASGTIAPAFHGMSAIVPATSPECATNRTTHGPTTHKPSAPQTHTPAVPKTTNPNKLFFSDFTRLWTSFGNITDASGITSHSNARDSVPDRKSVV